MSEVKAIETIDNTLGALAPDERSRVLGWAQAKYGNPMQPAAAAPTVPQAAHPDAPSSPVKPKVVSTPRSTKKPKIIISMDKSLNLSPTGKQSATQFGGQKAPTSVIQKSVVAVYYLRDILELDKVTIEGVLTFFKALSWPVPTDLKNTLQQAGTHGYLDTSDSQNIKLTSIGENLVEHDLPAKVKK